MEETKNIMTNCNGELDIDKKYPVKNANRPPIEIWIVDPKPEAVPASFGFTDTIPAAAFGKVNP